MQSDKHSNDLLMKQILDFFAENGLSFSDIPEILVNCIDLISGDQIKVIAVKK